MLNVQGCQNEIIADQNFVNAQAKLYLLLSACPNVEIKNTFKFQKPLSQAPFQHWQKKFITKKITECDDGKKD